MVEDGGFTYNGTADVLYFPPRPAIPPKPEHLKSSVLEKILKDAKKPKVPTKPDFLKAISYSL